MVSVLAWSVVDHGFEPRLGQTKDYYIGMCCFSAKHAALRRKSKDWLAQNQNNSTCISADFSFSELALYKSNSACWSITKWTSSSLTHSLYYYNVITVNYKNKLLKSCSFWMVLNTYQHENYILWFILTNISNGKSNPKSR